MKEYLNLLEAEEYTGITKHTLRRLMYNGTLSFHRPKGTRKVLFKIDVLNALVENGKVDVPNVA